jgi:hypothetical protein
MVNKSFEIAPHGCCYSKSKLESFIQEEVAEKAKNNAVRFSGLFAADFSVQ